MNKIFKRGLIAIAPLAVTLVLILWLFNALEALFRPLVEWIVTPAYYFPGMGILTAFIVIFFVGTALNSWIMQNLSKYGETLVRKIPLVKTLYNSIGEMMGYFSSKESDKARQVVLVEIQGVKLIGLVTRDSFSDLPEGLGSEGEIAVYIPMSYQIGGYTVIVSRSKVQLLSMTVEEGMRFAVTAGVLSKPKKTSF